jgi:hypothetical protein
VSLDISEINHVSEFIFSAHHHKLQWIKISTVGLCLTYVVSAVFTGCFPGQEWLDNGIFTNQSMDWIQCESTHLTAFSVLLDPSVGMPIPDRHKHVLSIISYIGSICSIIGLFLTILTYSMFR